MTHRIHPAIFTLFGATALSTYLFGGWALITVDALPDHLQAGTPTEISFMVRQHGVEPMHGLSPSIEARTGGMIGGTTVRAEAKPGTKRGQYVASITVPKTGEWLVTIHHGYGRGNVTLLPIQATDGKASVATIAEVERGKRLFVAKGCISCHVDDRVGMKGVYADFGPNLTDKAYDPAYLAMWLENPRIKPPTKRGPEMPNLGLSKKEVASLTVFINSGKTAATAREP